MSLIQSQTWKFQVNNIYPNTGNITHSKYKFLIALKDALKSSGAWTDADGNASTAPNTGGWVVEGSGTANNDGAMDQVDRWTDYTALNSGTIDRNIWIVFSNTNIHPTMQIALNLYLISNTTLSIKSSLTGFSVSSGDAAPTAPDEVILSQGVSNNMPVAAESFILHNMKTEDGLSSRTIICRNGFVTGYFAFEKPDNISGWSSPLLVTNMGFNTTTAISSNERLTYTLLSPSNVLSTGPAAGNSQYGLVKVFYSGEGTTSGLLGSVLGNINQISGSYGAYPVGFYAPDTVKGKMGNPYDLWWASSSVPYGSTYPGDGSKQFAQFGNLIFPWNKTTPLLL